MVNTVLMCISINQARYNKCIFFFFKNYPNLHFTVAISGEIFFFFFFMKDNQFLKHIYWLDNITYRFWYVINLL